MPLPWSFKTRYSKAFFRTTSALGRSFTLSEVDDFHWPSLSLYLLSKETVLYSVSFPSLVPVFFHTVALIGPAMNFASGRFFSSVFFIWVAMQPPPLLFAFYFMFP